MRRHLRLVFASFMLVIMLVVLFTWARWLFVNIGGWFFR